MTDATRRFENLSALKSKSLGRLVHGPNDHRGGVVRVEGGGASGTVFLVGQDFGKLNLLLAPARIIHIEDLGHGPPADIFDQRRLLIGRRWSVLGIQRAQNFNRTEILLELLFRPAFSELIRIGNAVGIGISAGNLLAGF